MPRSGSGGESAKTSIDESEIARIEAWAAEWWDESGKFKPLHKFNPVRLAYIRDQACAHFGRDPKKPKPLSGLRLLDIGCGGGLLSEPMARLGADIVAADASAANIEIARAHARQSGLTIDYRATSAENLSEAGETFDLVLNMEVIEHVDDPDFFLKTCCRLVRPNGLMFIATINRTFKAKLLAIFIAERVLRWLPEGSHNYEKLVRPEEIEKPVRESGMEICARTGVFYDPFRDRWDLSADMEVNYIMVARRP